VTLAELVPLAINASLFLIVFALGLSANLSDATFLFRQPVLLVRSLLAMNVVMLAFAVAVALLFDIDPSIKIALVALALSPVPPTLPGKQQRSGGTASYAIGLFVAASVVAIGLIPLTIELLGPVFGVEMHVPASNIASILMMSFAVPLIVGMAVRHFATNLAVRIVHPISKLATVLLACAFLLVLINAYSAIWAQIGNGVVFFIVLFTGIGVAAGHFLGGPDPDNRTVLALATATRHPAVAMAIASATFPNQKAVAIVMLFHIVLSGIVSGPYAKWRTRVHEGLAIKDAK
jgi:BASS family bile acid:Na+ symporter